MLAQLPAELERLGVRRALVLSTPQQADAAQRVVDLLGERAAGLHAGAVMHVPVASAREAVEVARRLGADGAVAFGGGSTTGLGKAIALETGLPIVAVPTTYAGSEVTLDLRPDRRWREAHRPRPAGAAAHPCSTTPS